MSELNMSIYCVVANVDLAIRKPSVEVLVRGVESLCKLLMPVDFICLFGKVFFSVCYRVFIDGFCLFIDEVVAGTTIWIAYV
jgi:hypothetical protein